MVSIKQIIINVIKFLKCNCTSHISKVKIKKQKSKEYTEESDTEIDCNSCCCGNKKNKEIEIEKC